jgi:hypothetical protein
MIQRVIFRPIPLILLLLLPFTLQAHKFYTSVTQLDFNPSEKCFQVTMNVFIDDLEAALTQENKQVVKWKSDQPALNTLLLKYLSKHLNVKLNQKPASQFRFIGTKEQKDLLIIYFEIPVEKTLKNIEITDTFLMDMFPIQSNIVNLNYQDKKHTFLFQKGKSTQFFSLK